MRVRIWHRAIPGSVRGLVIETLTVVLLSGVALATAFVLTRIF